VIAVPVIARAIFCLNQYLSHNLSFRRFRPEIALLALSFALLAWNKGVNFGNLFWFGGHSPYFGYEALQTPRWKPKEQFRTVSLFESPTANIVAGFYGLETFDGQVSVNIKHWADYWVDIVRRDQHHGLTTRIGGKWQYWNGSTYDVEKHIRLDLLRIANVRFLISPIPLRSGQLTAVYTPKMEDWAKARLEMFTNKMDFVKYRVTRIFDPGKLFIYELSKPTPRIFTASKLKITSDTIDPAALHSLVAEFAPQNIVIVKKADAKYFRPTANLKITSTQKVVDGFHVTVDAPSGGILLINNMYLPFWKARSDGKALKIVPANSIHMAISIPPGTKNVQIRYDRPLLREKIKDLF